ncbi:hypothetical protein PSAC2689_20129 [Paraburkholderia sacchari]
MGSVHQRHPDTGGYRCPDVLVRAACAAFGFSATGKYAPGEDASHVTASPGGRPFSNKRKTYKHLPDEVIARIDTQAPPTQFNVALNLRRHSLTSCG